MLFIKINNNIPNTVLTMSTPNCNAILPADYLSLSVYEEAFKYINDKLPAEYKDKVVKVGVVCGSGLGGLVSLLKEPIVEFKYEVKLRHSFIILRIFHTLV